MNKMVNKDKNKKVLTAFLIMVFSTLFTAGGQIFLKLSSAEISLNWLSLLNLNLFLGFVVYGIATFTMLYAFKLADLSLMYPLISLSFIWVLLIGYFLFNEPITLLKTTAIIFIMAGAVFMKKGGAA